MDPVVEKALETLTTFVKPIRGLTHPNDKATVIDIFRRLTKAGVRYEVEECRAWLARTELDESSIVEICTIATSPTSSRSNGESALREDILDYWND